MFLLNATIDKNSDFYTRGKKTNNGIPLASHMRHYYGQATFHTSEEPKAECEVHFSPFPCWGASIMGGSYLRPYQKPFMQLFQKLKPSIYVPGNSIEFSYTHPRILFGPALHTVRKNKAGNKVRNVAIFEPSTDPTFAFMTLRMESGQPTELAYFLFSHDTQTLIDHEVCKIQKSPKSGKKLKRYYYKSPEYDEFQQELWDLMAPPAELAEEYCDYARPVVAVADEEPQAETVGDPHDFAHEQSAVVAHVDGPTADDIVCGFQREREREARKAEYVAELQATHSAEEADALAEARADEFMERLAFLDALQDRNANLGSWD